MGLQMRNHVFNHIHTHLCKHMREHICKHDCKYMLMVLDYMGWDGLRSFGMVWKVYSSSELRKSDSYRRHHLLKYAG